MLFKPTSFFTFLLLISNFILVILADYSLGIRRDETLQTTYVWSSVAVYDSKVDTTTFSQIELYGLAQKAWNEMQATFTGKSGGRTYPNRQQPFTMSAMATKNLIYFASSSKGTNYIQDVASQSPVAVELQMCQAGLQAMAEPGQTINPLHMNKASCGEIGCMLLWTRDDKRDTNGDAGRRVIVAYGGRKDSGMQMPCCGSPAAPGSDPTSWGCHQFMQSQNVDMPDTTQEALVLPSVQPQAIRYISFC